MKKIEMNKLYNKKTVFGLLALVFLFTLPLFYLFISVYSTSDFPAHIRHALRGDGYSIIRNIISLISILTDNMNYLAIVMSLLIVLTVVFTTKAIFVISETEKNNKNIIIYTLFSISLLFICKLCIPEWSGYFYLGAFVTQPWHNSTYILMRTFGIVTFILYFIIRNKYLNEFPRKELIAFLIFLVLTNYSKPNFVMSFAIVMLINLINDFIKTKGKNFKNAFIWGLLVLISLAILVYQYVVCFPEGGSNGVAFSLDNAISYFTQDKKFLLHVILNFLFPIYITYIMYRNRKEIEIKDCKLLCSSWLMFIISFLEARLLTETGDRALHGNFGWGIPMFSYIVFMACLSLLIKYKGKKLLSDETVIKSKLFLIAHIIFGIFYYALLLMGYLSYGI